MAAVARRPAWQDDLSDELDVDWGDPPSSSSSPASSPERPGGGATGTWRSHAAAAAADQSLGEGDMSLDADLSPAKIRVSPSAAPFSREVGAERAERAESKERKEREEQAGQGGTMVIHPSAPVQKVVVQANNSSRNLFSPTKLESMFAPFASPSPPAAPTSPSPAPPLVPLGGVLQPQQPETSPSPPAFRNPYATRHPSRLNQVHMPEPSTPTASSGHNSRLSAIHDLSHPSLAPGSPLSRQQQHYEREEHARRSLAPSPEPSMSPQKPPFLPPDLDQPGQREEEEDEILETDIPHLGAFAGRIRSETFTFFSPPPPPPPPPRPAAPTPAHALAAAGLGNLSSAGTPGADARLKLFHPGGYDTYTRAHLSGVLDSIGVESATPSAGSAGASTPSSAGGVGGAGRREGEPPAKRMRMMGTLPWDDAGRERSPFELSEPPKARNVPAGVQPIFGQEHQEAGGEEEEEEEDEEDEEGEREEVQVRRERRDYVKESDAFMRAIRDKALAVNRDDTSSTSASFSDPSPEAHRQQLTESTRIDRPLRSSSEAGTIPTFPSRVQARDPVERQPAPTQQLQQQQQQARPANLLHPTSQADLNRYVSTGSNPTRTASGSSRSSALHTLGSGSGSGSTIPSYQKHPGPASPVPPPTSSFPATISSSAPPARASDSEAGPRERIGHPAPNHPQMRNLRPEDVASELSDRVGKMRYERETGRWVKRRSLSGVVEGSEGSEDVFRGIEDLGDGDEGREEGLEQEERQEEDDRQEEEHEDSWEKRKEEYQGYEQEEYEHDEHEPHDEHDEEEQEEQEDLTERHEPPPPLLHLPSAPAGLTVPNTSSGPFAPATPAISRATSAPTPMPRSALKSGASSRRNSADPFGSATAPRSVSFSDGRRIGQIVGLGRRGGTGMEERDEFALGSSEEDEERVGGAGQGDTTTVASVRTRRIQGMLEEFADMSLEDAEHQANADESDNPFSESPSHGRISRTSGTSLSTDHSSEDAIPTSFSALKRKPSRSFINGNATFLTECSFGVAHDALVKYITDAEPYVVHWERLTRVDLSGKGIDSVARLKEFLPVVERVDLNDNRIPWLTGLPATVLRLSVASNALTGLTAYKHVPKLQYLNISHNQVDSFQQLAGLSNLRELHADYNCITSLDGLEALPLRVLTAKGNKIQQVDVRMTQWHDMEVLDLSQNQISELQGVELLDSLVTLNLDGNRLEYFSILGARLPTLHVLRLSENRLSTLNVAGLDSLRTLYADDNRLSEIIGLEDCRTLHNLSLRNQSQKLRFTAREVSDVKRLYLSGNPLPKHFFSRTMPNLVYAEFSSCQLAALPALRQIMPNVVTLVLNWNHFRQLDFLQGLRHLQRVVVVGCRVESLQADAVLGGLHELRELDLRMNTFSLGWYLPITVDTERKTRQQSATEGKSSEEASLRASAPATPEDLDKKYRRGLPDELYVPRAMWRGMVMEYCPTVERLDGLKIQEKERVKTRKLLEQLRQAGVVLDGAEP